MNPLKADRYNKDNTVWVFVGVCIFTLIMYLGLLSRHYDVNGIAEVEKIDAGELSLAFFTPNHILYNPLGLMFYRIWQFFGFSGPAMLPTQVLTGISAALAAGMFFLILKKLTDDILVSILGWGGFAFSYAYWVQSTDAYYFMTAMFFVALAMLFFLEARDEEATQRRRRTYTALLGLASGMSILLYQGNVLLLPALVVGLFFTSGGETWRARLGQLTIFSVSLAATVGIPYLLVAIFVVGVQSLTDLVAWGASYGGDDRYSPIYGVIELGRIRNSLIALVGQVVPLRDGIGLRKLLSGQITPGKIIPQLSLFFTIVTTLVSTAYLLRYHRELVRRYGWLFIFAIICFAPYAVFNTWWDPDELFAWFPAVLPIWMIWALLVADARKRLPSHMSRYAMGFVGVFVIIVFLSTLTSAIIPRRFAPNINMQKARFAAEQMGENDLIVTVTWNWSGYMDYFTDQEAIDLTAVFAKVGSKEEVLAHLDQVIASRHNNQGRVFLIDVHQYDDGQWQWITENTGLEEEDFADYEFDMAWSYLGETVWEIRKIDVLAAE